MRIALPIGLLLGALAAACATGEHAAELVLPDPSGTERVVLPVQAEAKATVFLFAAVDCPISNAYAPEVHRIRDEYTPQGVEFLLVYADTDSTPEDVARHVEDYGYALPALLDFEHELVRHTGASMTPEAVVLAPDGELVYRGRIDDLWVGYGKQRPKATRRELRLVLDAVLRGERPEVDWAEPIGCFIPEPAVVEGAAPCCEE